jgi:hypothetical protein
VSRCWNPSDRRGSYIFIQEAAAERVGRFRMTKGWKVRESDNGTQRASRGRGSCPNKRCLLQSSDSFRCFVCEEVGEGGSPMRRVELLSG